MASARPQGVLKDEIIGACELALAAILEHNRQNGAEKALDCRARMVLAGLVEELKGGA